MAISLHTGSMGHSEHPLTPRMAMRISWICYLTLAFLPFFVFVGVIAALSNQDGAVHQSARQAWFMWTILAMILAAPTVFWIRSWLFKSYWQGESVAPWAYLTGNLIVWLTFSGLGIASLIGCWMGGSLVPCILPALGSFVFFMPAWPNGKAMSRPVGDSDDPEIYSEPR